VSPLWTTSEEVLLDKVGLDGVAFLRFLRMLAWSFLCISVLTCGALIPINVSYNYNNVDPDERNTLSILTIQDVKGTTLFFRKSPSQQKGRLEPYRFCRRSGLIFDQYNGTRIRMVELEKNGLYAPHVVQFGRIRQAILRKDSYDPGRTQKTAIR